MWILTYKGKPITLETMLRIEKRQDTIWRAADEDLCMYVAADRKMAVIDFYLHYIGFTWKERMAGIAVERREY